MKLPAILSTAQAAAGAALLLRPAGVARLASGGGRTAPGVVVRVLGARTLAQALVLAAAERRRRDVRPVLVAGAVVDALHAASMVVTAFWKRDYRRSALASAGAAGLSAGTGLVAAWRTGG